MNYRYFRNKNEYTQKAIADILEIPLSTYRSYETGICDPGVSVLVKLANIYNITVDELLGRTQTPGMFDDARVERPEILELFEDLSPAQQQNLLNYARGMAVANQLDKEESIVQNKKRA